MKKFLAIMLSALLLLTFVACSPDEDLIDEDDMAAADNTYTNNDGLGTFTYDINRDGHYSITGYNTVSSSKHEITIPSEIDDIKVTGIAAEAFKACTNLTAVTIPESVTFIDELAFYGCDSLTALTIPASVTEIGTGAFRECENLKTISLSANLTELADQLFWGCAALEAIEIPAAVTAIGEATFWECDAISEVAIPAAVKTIGNTAFYGCDALAKISVPASVETIGEAVFTSLASETVEFTTPAGSAFATYFAENYAGNNEPDFPGYKLIAE